MTADFVNLSALLLFNMHSFDQPHYSIYESQQADITIPFSLSELTSNTAEVKHALPQGSILGLLWVIFSCSYLIRLMVTSMKPMYIIQHLRRCKPVCPSFYNNSDLSPDHFSKNVTALFCVILWSKISYFCFSLV